MFFWYDKLKCLIKQNLVGDHVRETMCHCAFFQFMSLEFSQMLFGHFWARDNYVCATIVSPLNSKNNVYVYSVGNFQVVQNLNMISLKSTLFMSW